MLQYCPRALNFNPFGPNRTLFELDLCHFEKSARMTQKWHWMLNIQRYVYTRCKCNKCPWALDFWCFKFIWGSFCAVLRKWICTFLKAMCKVKRQRWASDITKTHEGYLSLQTHQGHFEVFFCVCAFFCEKRPVTPITIARRLKGTNFLSIMDH